MAERVENRSPRPKPYYSLTDKDLEQSAFALLGTTVFIPGQEGGVNPVIRTMTLVTLAKEQDTRRKSQTALLRRLGKKGGLSLEELAGGVTFQGSGKDRQAVLDTSKISYLQDHGLAEAFEGYSFSKRSKVYKEAERIAQSKAAQMRTFPGEPQLNSLLRVDELTQAAEPDPDSETPEYTDEGFIKWKIAELEELKAKVRSTEAPIPEEKPKAASRLSTLPDWEEDEVPIRELAEALARQASQVIKVTAGEGIVVESPAKAGPVEDLLTPPTTAQRLKEVGGGVEVFGHFGRVTKRTVYVAATFAGIVVGAGLAAMAILGDAGSPRGSEANQEFSSPVPTGDPSLRQTQIAGFAASPTRSLVPGADTTNVETRIAFQRGPQGTVTPSPENTLTPRITTVTATFPTGREIVATITVPPVLSTVTPSPTEGPPVLVQAPLMDSSEEAETGEEPVEVTSAELSTSLPPTGGFPINKIPVPAKLGMGLLGLGILAKVKGSIGSLWKRSRK